MFLRGPRSPFSVSGQTDTDFVRRLVTWARGRIDQRWAGEVAGLFRAGPVHTVLVGDVVLVARPYVGRPCLLGGTSRMSHEPW
jgi:hypothetical protein